MNLLDRMAAVGVREHLAGPMQRLVAESGAQCNCALNAIVFVYNNVLRDELGPDHLGEFHAMRARRSKRIPTVLSVGVVRRILNAIGPDSGQRLVVKLLYVARHVMNKRQINVTSPLDRLGTVPLDRMAVMV
jgi:hypothetical protein